MRNRPRAVTTLASDEDSVRLILSVIAIPFARALHESELARDAGGEGGVVEGSRHRAVVHARDERAVVEPLSEALKSGALITGLAGRIEHRLNERLHHRHPIVERGFNAPGDGVAVISGGGKPGARDGCGTRRGGEPLPAVGLLDIGGVGHEPAHAGDNRIAPDPLVQVLGRDHLANDPGVGGAGDVPVPAWHTHRVSPNDEERYSLTGWLTGPRWR